MKNIATITVDKKFDIGESNAIMIDSEILQILPIDSKDGQLFQFVDKDKNNVALLRLKRSATMNKRNQIDATQ